MAQQMTKPPIVKGGTYRMTFDEFEALVPKNWQAEWVDGKVYVFMGAIERHGAIVSFLMYLLARYLGETGKGRVYTATYGMRVRDGASFREPDIMVILTEHAERITRPNVAGPADFIVELISEDSVGRDRRDKYLEYEAVGVPEYVIIDARDGREGFEYFRLNDVGRYEAVRADDEGRFHSAVLPGLWLEAAWFRGDDVPNAGPLADQMVALAPE